MPILSGGPVTASLSRPDLAFVHTKVMSDLVPDRVHDDLLEMREAARHLLDRLLKDGDPVGHREAFRYAPVGKRPAFVKTEQG